MNFLKYAFVLVVIVAVFSGQAEAGWLKKIGKKIERVGQNVRNAAISTLPIAQGAAGVAGALNG
uniref:Cecropin TY1 n=1 Tax=Tabanus yao TaxID=485572 RepID=C1IBY1_TABYA|nr:cecropin TY1 [Tabanus yao]